MTRCDEPVVDLEHGVRMTVHLGNSRQVECLVDTQAYRERRTDPRDVWFLPETVRGVPR